MTWRDKLEIGLKDDAGYRKDNLPLFQVRGPETPTGPGRSPVVAASRNDPGPSGQISPDALPYAGATEEPEPAADEPAASAAVAMLDEGAPPRHDD